MKSQRVQTGKKGKQDWETPDPFFKLCHQEFRFAFDLAAHRENRKRPFHLGPGSRFGVDSLAMPWHQIEGWCWLNPPFGSIGPWARKCLEESEKGGRIAMLTLASTGSNWFRDFCWQRCEIRLLNGRMTFKGADSPFPKDLALYVFDRRRKPKTIIWDWRKEITG